MEKLIADFAQLGVGYLIAALSIAANIWLFKRLDDKDKVIKSLYDAGQAIQDKRVAEAAEYGTGYINAGKEITSSIDSLKEAQQAFTRFIEKFSTVKNV